MPAWDSSSLVQARDPPAPRGLLAASTPTTLGTKASDLRKLLQ